MRKWILLFLFFASPLKAEWDQFFSEDADPTLFHHVNVITGNLNLCIEDTQIQGAKPLPIFRTYSSAGALESSELNQALQETRDSWLLQGGRSFLPHVNLLIEVRAKYKSFQIYLPEPSGNLIPYIYVDKKSDDVLLFKPQKGYAQCSGILSGKTNTKNNLLELHVKKGEALLFLPNGGSRIYIGRTFRHWDEHKLRHINNTTGGKCYYRLIKEILPSRHVILYSYDDKERLVGVSITNPSMTKTFADMSINLLRKKSPFAFEIKTSDAKTIQYKTLEFNNVDYLCNVQSSARPEESAHYVPGRKKIGARIDKFNLGGQLQFEATYYVPPNEKEDRKWDREPEKKHFSADKVHSLQAPLGPNGEMISFAVFSYFPGKTEVRDTSNNLTRYHHDAGHLLAIEYCNERDEIVSILKFIWDEDRLCAKVLFNEQAKAYFSKTFKYDPAGNVVEETLWGNLSGSTPPPFYLHPDGSLQDAEHYSKRYEYLPGFNLPLLEEEENGLSYRYQYKHDTDLLTSKLTSCKNEVLKREFFFYNEDNLLTAEITDDGISDEPNNLNRVTKRQIKRYHLNPASGLAHAATESYLDPHSGTETLLKKVVYAYSKENRVVEEAVYDAEDIYRYTSYTSYDPQGRITRKTSPLGQENTYSYNPLGQLLTAKEISAPKKIFSYDPAGRPASIKEVDDLGEIKETFTKYDSAGRLRAHADSKGNVTKQSYDAFGRCIKTEFPPAIDEEGMSYTPTASFTYDIQGNLSSSTIDGAGTTQTHYNVFRKPIQIIQADGTLLRHIYNQTGTLAQTIYPDGTHHDYSYDMFQRTTSKIIYSPNQELLSQESWSYNTFHLLAYTNPNGLTTYYTYDGAGRDSSIQAESRTLTYLYDPLGFLKEQTQAETTHVAIHDVGGRVIEQWEKHSDGSLENHMWFSYNAENKKTQAIRLTSQGKAADFFFYDREFRLIRHIDPLQNTTEFLYTEEETNDLGQHVLQKTVIDPLRNQTIETYDALNRVTQCQQKDPNGKTVSRENLFYDKAGNVAKRVSTLYHLSKPQNQIFVRWEYDPMGRPIKESEGNSKTTRLAYDKNGRLITRLLPNGTALRYAYDGLNRLLEMKSSDGTIHYQYFYEYTSDPVEIFDCIQNNSLKRQYNPFGQLTQEINPYGLTTSWQYDSHGRCIAYTLPNDSSITYSYTGNHLTQVTRLSSDQQPLYTHTYTAFDPNGHVCEEELIHNLGTLTTTHDLLERPTEQNAPWLNQDISYGPSSLVSNIHSSLSGDKIYEYDALNQLILDNNQRYQFDSLGNPIHCLVNECNQILKGPNYSLAYDPNGNPTQHISQDKTTLYTYDALGRLTTLTHPDGKQTRYFYDPLSRLMAEATNNTTSSFYLYDHDQEIGALNEEGTLIQLKILGLGLKGEIGAVIAIELGENIYAPINDFNGNITALLSSDQKIIESYQIDAFGKEITSAPPLNPWRFCSKRSTNNLVLFGQRFYNPALGRWLTPDPSGFADGPNLYVYVLNSPLNRLDLFGLQSDPRFPEMRIEAPISQIRFISTIPSTSQILNCKGFVSNTLVDWVVCSKHWTNLQFTPQEEERGIVNIFDHLHELLPKEGSPIGIITKGNGIHTTQKDVFENTRSVSNMIPEGTLIVAMHNPTKGLFRDAMRTITELFRKDTSIVVTTRQMMIAISDSIYKINPDLLWLHITHSEGGVITTNAIEGMTEQQKSRLQQQIHLLGIAPAHPLAIEYGRRAVNIYSNQDFVTGGFGLAHSKNEKYDIVFVPCLSSLSERTGYIADHAFLGTTYNTAVKNQVRKLREQEGFFDAKNR